MPASYAVLFSLLVAVPGLLIPLYIIARARGTPGNDQRNGVDRMIIRGTVILMVALMAFSVYAALAIYTSLDALAR